MTLEEKKKRYQKLKAEIKKEEAEKRQKKYAEIGKLFCQSTGIKEVINPGALEEYFRRYAEYIKNTQKE